MKLTTVTQVTIDGVMQGNGHASDEDRRIGFERGGWARGKGDNETWGTLTVQDAPGWESVVEALNTRPKYVASTTLTDPAWSDTTVLSGDVAAAVRELKARPGVSCRCTAVAS
jgi:hypothetical protein